jgi:hypothetical protein
VLAPTPTLFDTSREVEVASLPTIRLTVGLAEPATFDPALGENVAISCAVEAAKDVRQTTAAL